MKTFAAILSLMVASAFACEEVKYGLNSIADCAILYKNTDCRYIYVTDGFNMKGATSALSPCLGWGKMKERFGTLCFTA